MQRLSSHSSRGFTLIEMVVTIAIVGIISAVVMFQYSKYDSQLLLKNLAYEIALQVREAQVFGISVRGDATGFSAGYGVHFSMSTPTQYFLFRDINNDLEYDNGELIVSRHTIGRGNRIMTLCAGNGPFPTPSSAGCDSGSGETLDIVFRRPHPDAIVNGGGPEEATIYLTSAQASANIRSVSITATGQISVQ